MAKAARKPALKRRKSSLPSAASQHPHPGDDPAYAFSGVVADRIELKPTASLHLSSYQARTHDEHQIALIMGSFDRFGLINPIIVDENDEIIAGAARFEAARRLKIHALPAVLVTHLSADEKRAYRLTDNRIAELAGWDKAALAIEFEHLIEIDFDLGSLGFTVPEIDIVLCGDEADAAPDDDGGTYTPPVVPVSRRGDLF